MEKEIYKSNNLEHKRVLGYVGEILLTVYIEHNNYKVKEYYLRYMESRSNLLANLINDSYALVNIYDYIYLKNREIE